MAPPLTARRLGPAPYVPSGGLGLPDPSPQVVTLRRYMWMLGLHGGALLVLAGALATGALIVLGRDASAAQFSGGGICGAAVVLVMFAYTWRGLLGGLRDALPLVAAVRRGRPRLRSVVRTPGTLSLVCAFATVLTLLSLVAGGSALQLQVLIAGLGQIVMAAATITWLATRERGEQRRYLVRVETVGERAARDLLWEPSRPAAARGVGDDADRARI